MRQCVRLSIAVGLLLVVAVPGRAEEATSDRNAESVAVRATTQAFMKAFNAHDAEKVSQLWTKDGDFVAESGETYSGRDAIRQGYADFFAQNPKVQIRIFVDSVRLLSDSAAIEDGRAVLEPPPAGAPVITKYTAVHVKSEGQWKMSTVRDSVVEVPSNYRRVAALEWLIGTWTAEEHGAKTEMECRWIANKSFIQRSYSVTQANGLVVTGVQIIGYDPVSERIQSWSFQAGGGHSIGMWVETEDGWAVQTESLDADGRRSSAVNEFRRLDDDAFAWKSTQRTDRGLMLPDTEEVVLKRSPGN